MKPLFIAVFCFTLAGPVFSQPDSMIRVMDGFPPSRKSQVTFQNYRDYPFSKWSFRNMGAPLHVLMIPRGGSIHMFKETSKSNAGNTLIALPGGKTEKFETIFKDNEADGVIVVQNNTILFEKYWNGLGRDYQHIWYSMTKSLTSSALGLLVADGRIDLTASPVKYVTRTKRKSL